MGFLDALFGNKEKKELDSIKLELDTLKAQFQKSNSEIKGDMDQIIKILSEFDEDISAIKKGLKNQKDFGASAADFSKALDAHRKDISELKKQATEFDRVKEPLKVMGKLTIQNHEALKSAKLKLNKLDALEKIVAEHVSLMPDAIVLKDEYFEQLENLKRRVELFEKHKGIIDPELSGEKRDDGEMLLISPERKRVKKR